MTDKQILKKAIKKCKENEPLFGDDSRYYSWDRDDSNFINNRYIYFLIFDHAFAKAFWGEEEQEIYICECSLEHPLEWQYHLKQMVLEKKPLKYLEKFLTN